MTTVPPRPIAQLRRTVGSPFPLGVAAVFIASAITACRSVDTPARDTTAAPTPTTSPASQTANETVTVCMEKGPINEVASTALSVLTFALRESHSKGPPRCVVDPVAVYERNKVGNLLIVLDFDANSIVVSGPRVEVERAARLIRAIDASPDPND